MTTHITPADHGRRPLETGDPAELLAQTRLCMREAPVDSLILTGSGGAAVPSLITRSSLQDLLSPAGPRNLAMHLEHLRERGIRRVRALAVIGDGYEDLLAPVVEEVLRRVGELLHAATDPSGTVTPDLLGVSGAAAGRSWTLLFAPGAAPQPLEDGALREFVDTRAAATAVLGGQRLPTPRAEDPLLARIGGRLALLTTDLASSADPGELFAAARRALEELRRAGGDLEGPGSMTKCEQIAALLGAVAVERLHWELLAQCVDLGSERPIERETLLQTLVADASWRPHPDVCAGGQWYEGLLEMRQIAAGTLSATAAPRRGTARSAWRGLTALLVLLAWWNHRFATAGSLVDELREVEPHSTLAPLLSRMTDTPIFPAWRPTP